MTMKQGKYLSWKKTKNQLMKIQVDLRGEVLKYGNGKKFPREILTLSLGSGQNNTTNLGVK
jgi:hypothetical protein